jgi:uncharacterized protein (TIGR02996 family)
MSEKALLAAVIDAPEDDTPRLVLADWLAEHDTPTLPELIRLQCRAARMSHRERRHQRVEQRVAALEQACAREWLRPLGALGLTASFARGLLRVTAPLDAPLRAEVAALADTERWAWVEAVAVTGVPWGLEGLQGWLSSGLWRGVGLLTLGAVLLGAPEAEALGGGELPLLHELRLHPHRVSANGLRCLARTPLAGRLDTLSIYTGGTNGIGPGGAAALAAGSLDGLRSLDLQGEGLGDAGAEALGAAAWLGRLRHLNLLSNNIGARGARALLHGPRALPLASVLLANNPLGIGGAAVVAGAPSLPGARELHLHGCGIGPAGAAVLAGSPGVAGLTTLYLYGNRLGCAGVEALASSPHLANLTTLYLGQNDVRDAGARALLASPHLRRLRTLSLHGNPIREGVRQALRERFGRGAGV